jgi:serine/threonine protein kinase/tetratricopeptide (TPR) repeat protein
MNATQEHAKSIFLNAIEIAAPGERQAFVESQCAGNDLLRAEVDELLQHERSLGNFLESPPAGLDATAVQLNAECPGTTIGPYKLLEQIGEGGFGVVFLAEQSAPVRRKVALKIIKPGMDTRQVIARFEAERQALAMMDHPNIAKVLDAGTTSVDRSLRERESGSRSEPPTLDPGRPYFVMELVQGVPITDYCDQCNLTTRERLELFITVCQAVQHAHQKGVIHRDIKPTNVLVAMHDGRAAPKIIDFGVAKAMGERLTEHTLTIGFAQMLGTPMYMSPEQAELSPLGVDTRSDIYSLGVLLYELLTGTTPFDKERLHSASYDELRRIIREEEPPRPSTRISSLSLRERAGVRETAALTTTIAAHRHTDPRRLIQSIRGELDWIVMKCLEKDRNRRYETPNSLARDIERYLHDEPVQACPPSAAYRFRKFAKRNKESVMAASMILLTLVAGILGTTMGLIRAEKARQAETEQRQTAEAREAESRAILNFVETKIFAAAGPEGTEGGLGREVTLRNAIESALPFVDNSFPNQPIIEARLRSTLGTAFFDLGEAGKAAEQFQKARTLFSQALGANHRDTLTSMCNLSNCYYELGRHSEALQLRQETLALQKTELGPNHRDTLESMASVASDYVALGREKEALQLRVETLALQTARLGPDDPDTLLTMMSVANSYESFNRHDDALKLREKTLALQKVRFGPTHRLTLLNMHNLANSYCHLGRHDDALKLREETLALQKANLGPDHRYTLLSMYNLAGDYSDVGRNAEALKLYEKTLVLATSKLGPDHPQTLDTMYKLAAKYADFGRHADALALHEKTLALRQAKLGPDHADTLESMCAVASSLDQLDRSSEALPLIDESLKRAEGKSIRPDVIEGLLYHRLRHMQKMKDAAGCRATAEMLEKLECTDADSLYNVACMRAVTATVIEQDPKLLPADASRLVRDEADRAMAWLNKAVAAGFYDDRLMKQDADLKALHDRPDFQKLLGDLERKTDGAVADQKRTTSRQSKGSDKKSGR